MSGLEQRHDKTFTDFHISGEGRVHVGDSNVTNVHNYSASNPEDHECLRALRLSDPRTDRAAILSRKDELLGDTCRWVCDDAGFIRWWHDEKAQTFWINGDPGKEKTMLMMALVDELSARLNRSPDSSTHMAYFFCQGTSNYANNASRHQPVSTTNVENSNLTPQMIFRSGCVTNVQDQTYLAEVLVLRCRPVLFRDMSF